MIYFLIPWFAFCNLARGRKLFNCTDSTTVSRLIATMNMAFGVMLLHFDTPQNMAITMLETWGLLMLWCSPAWDNLWSATIGHPFATLDCPSWINWILGRFSFFDAVYARTAQDYKNRLWGLCAFGLRMTYAVPAVALFNPWLAFLTPLLALPYYLMGYVTQNKYLIPISEICTGAILGGLMS